MQYIVILFWVLSFPFFIRIIIIKDNCNALNLFVLLDKKTVVVTMLTAAQPQFIVTISKFKAPNK